MIFIVDVNVILSALIKNGKSRELLIDSPFTLYSPDSLISSIRKYEDFTLQKSGLSKEDFDTLLSLILENIVIVEKDQYQEQIPEAQKIMEKIDAEDVPYIALAISISNNGIWSDDAHFDKQNKVEVWKTIDIIEELEKERID